MSKEALTQLRDAITAHLEGKPVQYRESHEMNWIDANCPNFQAKDVFWRPKPQPREWWINRYPGRGLSTYESKTEADQGMAHDRVECVHVIEVL